MKYKKLSEREFERKANELAREYVEIQECQKCGNPHIQQYCCRFCGATDPAHRADGQIRVY